MLENNQATDISLINQAQLAQLETEDISYNKTPDDTRIDQLIRPPYSSRKPIENLLKKVSDSLHQFDFLGGIFVEASTMYVIDGWHRLQVWQQMGHKTIPSYLVDCTPEQERKLHLSLNTQGSAFDPLEFGLEYEGIDLEDFGFSKEDLELGEFNHTPKFNNEPTPEQEGFTKLSTTVPITTYDQLKAIKKETDSPTMATAITHLVNLYYETN